jgi:hypothetical protein
MVASVIKQVAPYAQIISVNIKDEGGNCGRFFV